MRLHYVGVIVLIACAALECTRGIAGNFSWHDDYSLRGLSEVDVVVVVLPTVDQLFRPLQPVVYQSVKEALNKSGVGVVGHDGRSLQAGTPVLYVEIGAYDERPQGHYVYYVTALIRERFQLERDPTVLIAGNSWYHSVTVPLSHDPERTVLQGVAAAMEAVVQKFDYANAERHDEQKQADSAAGHLTRP